MRIGQVAEATGVPVKTLRYWEDVGVLKPAARTEAGYRNYGPETPDRVQFIRSAQAVGFSLHAIRGILELRSDGIKPCAHVEELLRRRLEDIDNRMQSLQHARSEVETALERARLLDPAECDERSVCHLILLDETPLHHRSAG